MFGDNKSKEYGATSEVAANGRRIFTVKMHTVLPGTARLQICCAAGKYGDASELLVPVREPPTSEAYALSGELASSSDATIQSITKPYDAIKGYGGNTSLFIINSIRCTNYNKYLYNSIVA